MHPPITLTQDEARTRAMQAHPSRAVRTLRPSSLTVDAKATRSSAEAPTPDVAGDTTSVSDDGSLVAEYGLVAVVGATVAALVINWASNGNIFELFSAVLEKVKVLVGA